MHKIRFRILALGFVVLLLLPTLDQIFGISARFKSTENYTPDRFPTFSLPKAGAFVREFKNYYNENFGFRNALVYCYSHWKFNLLGQSPLPEKVILGKHGWLFLGNYENAVVDQHRGLKPLSSSQARQIALHLALLQQKLAAIGTKLYVVIAPDAHSIYPEYLPDALTPAQGKTRLDMLAETVYRQTTVPFIDLRDTLIAQKPICQVYYKTDSHWNNVGAFIGCAKLLNRVRSDWGRIKPLQLSEYTLVKTVKGGGDLATLFMFQNEMNDTLFNLFPKASRKLASSTEITNEGNGYASYKLTGLDSQQPKLLLLGDSYSTSMMQFLGSCFSESYFVRDRHINWSLVRQEHPDILLVEIAERNIDWLADL